MDRLNYGTVMTTIAVALLILVFTTISGQIAALDCRLRTVEVQLAAISARLGIDPAAYRLSQSSDAEASSVDEGRALAPMSRNSTIGGPDER